MSTAYIVLYTYYDILYIWSNLRMLIYFCSRLFYTRMLCAHSNAYFALLFTENIYENTKTVRYAE